MCRARRGGPRTPSRTADTSLDCANFKNALLFSVPKIESARAPVAHLYDPSLSKLNDLYALIDNDVPCFQTLKSHRMILAMASPVFEAMFFGGLQAQNDEPIKILDVQPDAFKVMLQ